MDERPKMSNEEYNKKFNKGGDLPPLPLLPDRTWLTAIIVKVEYRYAMFNGKIQYVTRKEIDSETGQEIETPITDLETGEPIARKEFNIKFELEDFFLPNKKDKRCTWLTLGASMGEKSHLPQFLFNVLGSDYQAETPKQIIEELQGCVVRIQLKNKPNKDTTRPPYQNMMFDAVESIEKSKTNAVKPVKESDVASDIPF